MFFSRWFASWHMWTFPTNTMLLGGIQGKSLNNSTMFGVCVYMMCILGIIFSSYSIHRIRSIRVYTVFALQISVATFRYTPQKQTWTPQIPIVFQGNFSSKPSFLGLISVTSWSQPGQPELRLQLPASGAIFRMVEDLCTLDFRRPAWENTWSFPWMAVFQDARGCIILTQLSQLWHMGPHMQIVHLHLIGIL